MDDFDSGDWSDEEGERGGVRRTDPYTSHLAAANEEAIGTLREQTLEAFAFAHEYENGGMTSMDVARYWHRGNARDSYSPSVSKINEEGLTVWVGERLCANAAGDLVLMDCYRFRKPEDGEDIIRPPQRTRVQRMLSMWRKAKDSERTEFMQECEGPVLADFAWFLFKRLDEGERTVFLDWQVNGPG